ncbi:hypothetical protein TNCV_5004201 [Trichonephila clavipes]|nr:hypothetical protein TNCV_5004201 [Trichonephila clavipes]
MRYVSILSDGDAKTYQHLSSLNVYGNCIKIAKKNALTTWQKGFLAQVDRNSPCLEWRGIQGIHHWWAERGQPPKKTPFVLHACFTASSELDKNSKTWSVPSLGPDHHGAFTRGQLAGNEHRTLPIFTDEN